MTDEDKPKVWVCPIHGEVPADELNLHPSGQWGTHGYCSAAIIPTSQPEFYKRLEDDDKPLFTAGHMETLSYGPSWGSIIFLGLVGIVLLVVILVFA
jgi:hypothetical protein